MDLPRALNDSPTDWEKLHMGLGTSLAIQCLESGVKVFEKPSLAGIDCRASGWVFRCAVIKGKLGFGGDPIDGTEAA